MISAARGRLGKIQQSPAPLFASSEQGAWYDPSDLTTLFQDSAGTTPADHTKFYALAEEKKVTAPPKAAFDALMAAVDVSDEEPFAAMARMGLQLIRGELA